MASHSSVIFSRVVVIAAPEVNEFRVNVNQPIDFVGISNAIFPSVLRYRPRTMSSLGRLVSKQPQNFC